MLRPCLLLLLFDHHHHILFVIKVQSAGGGRRDHTHFVILGFSIFIIVMRDVSKRELVRIVQLLVLRGLQMKDGMLCQTAGRPSRGLLG